MAILDILMRFLHVVSAVVAVGGAFFLLVCLPAGLRLVDESRRDEVLLKVRRAFKMTVHPSILFLIVSGIYNTMKLWPAKEDMRRYHAFWGPHLLLALVVFGISLWLLAGKGLRAKHRTWLKVNVVLMMLTILAASGARWARLDIAKGKLAAVTADRDARVAAEAARTAAVGVPPVMPPPTPATQPATSQP